MRKTYRITICLANHDNLKATYKRIFKYILNNKELFNLSPAGIVNIKEHIKHFDYFRRNCTENAITKKGVYIHKMYVGCICNGYDSIFVDFYYGHTIYKDLEYMIITNK